MFALIMSQFCKNTEFHLKNEMTLKPQTQLGFGSTYSVIHFKTNPEKQSGHALSTLSAVTKEGCNNQTGIGCVCIPSSQCLSLNFER